MLKLSLSALILAPVLGFCATSPWYINATTGIGAALSTRTDAAGPPLILGLGYQASPNISVEFNTARLPSAPVFQLSTGYSAAYIALNATLPIHCTLKPYASLGVGYLFANKDTPGDSLGLLGLGANYQLSTALSLRAGLLAAGSLHNRFGSFSYTIGIHYRY